MNGTNKSTNYSVNSVPLGTERVSGKARYSAGISIELPDAAWLISRIKARGTWVERLGHLTALKEVEYGGRTVLCIRHHLSVLLHLLPKRICKTYSEFPDDRAGIILISEESHFLEITR
jgi:hypothetical protein